MTKEEITEIDCIHVATFEEYRRIIDIFKMDDEFLDWFYEDETVIYPFKNQYGVIDGICVEEGYNIIDSKLIY